MGAGRSSTFTQEIADAICKSLASGLSLRKTCMQDGFPCPWTVYDWLDARPDFRHQYARARELQADAHADEIAEISDEETHSPEESARNRLRVDARKWVASKLRPKVYGDKQAHEISGKDGGPVIYQAFTGIDRTPGDDPKIGS